VRVRQLQHERRRDGLLLPRICNFGEPCKHGRNPNPKQAASAPQKEPTETKKTGATRNQSRAGLCVAENSGSARPAENSREAAKRTARKPEAGGGESGSPHGCANPFDVGARFWVGPGEGRARRVWNR